MTHLRPLLCLLALLLTGSAQAFDLDALGTLLRNDHASTLNFVEYQYRKVLTTRIERRGQLIFTPPASFEKRVTEPTQERYLLTGNTLNIELPGRKSRQISTRNQPLLRGLLLGFQAVASGQLDALKPIYRVQVSGAAQDWQLELTPIDQNLAKFIQRVVVRGQQQQPRSFEVIETGGDRTLTEVLP